MGQLTQNHVVAEDAHATSGITGVNAENNHAVILPYRHSSAALGSRWNLQGYQTESGGT